jgi:class 3 adenylate cyclase
VSAGRILVVDDTPRNLRLLADLLLAAGYEVSTAGSGAEALERIAAERPDLVLLDVVMPSMSGYDVCRAIRNDEATRLLPVVMVTALEASVERVRGIEAGADDFLSKPIHQPELLARVRSLLRAKQLHDQVEDQARQLAEWNRLLEQRVATQVAELERLRRLKRFLPPQVAESLLAGDAEDPLQSHRREIAAVFLELRGFTAFAETTAPEEVMTVLQEYHQAIGQLVVEHEGTLERFTGDGMMVFFNDPLPQPDAALRAVRMALAMRERSHELARRWEKLGFELALGFGIAQGYATLGAIGFEARADYAAVGTIPNAAARLAEAARPGEILLSQRVRAAVEPEVDCEDAGTLDLRGFPRPVAAFRALRERRPGAADAVGVDGADRAFRLEGETWSITFQGAAFRLKDSKGLRYIAQLLRHPDQELHALDLIALGNDDSRSAGPVIEDADARGLGDAGSVLDASARRAYRERLDDLRSQRDEALSFNDAARAASVGSEIDFLSQQLAAAVGLGGRERRVGAAAERARVNVTRAISDGVKRIRVHSPALARYLDASLRTGAFCSYRPPDATPVAWRL